MFLRFDLEIKSKRIDETGLKPVLYTFENHDVNQHGNAVPELCRAWHSRHSPLDLDAKSDIGIDSTQPFSARHVNEGERLFALLSIDGRQSLRSDRLRLATGLISNPKLQQSGLLAPLSNLMPQNAITIDVKSHNEFAQDRNNASENCKEQESFGIASPGTPIKAVFTKPNRATRH
jgi:hypothetical protein